ncbi:MAG TPA: dihydrofolate reductase family protein [Kofleriaceae bacterium]
MKVVVDQTISVDGFITGPDDDKANPLGTGDGPKLFAWYKGGEIMFGDDRFAPRGRDREAVEQMAKAYGSFVTGRRTYDLTNAWDGTHPIVENVIVLTHRPATPPTTGRSRFSYTDDITAAVAQAKERAGKLDVAIGTAGAAQAAFAKHLVDEVWLHVAPLALGRGRALFQASVKMTPIDIIAGPGATHVRYRVER